MNQQMFSTPASKRESSARSKAKDKQNKLEAEEKKGFLTGQNRQQEAKIGMVGQQAQSYQNVVKSFQSSSSYVNASQDTKDKLDQVNDYLKKAGAR